MKSPLRSLPMLVAAVTMAVAPCVPALAIVPSCPMEGCQPSASGEVLPADCCCAASDAPATPSAPATLSAPLARVVPSAAALGDADFPAGRLLLPEAEGISPDHVPLFLLHSSFLI